MDRKATLLIVICLTAVLVLSGCDQQVTKNESAYNKKLIIATTFPIFQITSNVVKNHEGVSIELLLPSQLGCPHDYALTPQDVQKLAKGDILVVNGLGLEEFLGAPVKNANDKLIVVDSSQGIDETLQYVEGHACTCEHCEEAREKQKAANGATEETTLVESENGKHDNLNPHLFASPRMVAKLAVNIAAQLSEADPSGKDIYTENAKTYAVKMNKLADDMAALGKRLQNNRIVPTHGIFDYLARDMGLEVVAVMIPFSQEPSAAEMLTLVNTIIDRKAGGIFTEPQYPEKTGLVLSKETSVKVGLLDPVATGPDNAPLDYYETVMRKNLKTLEETLGVK